MRQVRRVGTAFVGALLALALIGACDSSTSQDSTPSPTPPSDSPTTGTTTPPTGLHLTFIQTRSLEGTQRAQIRAFNETDSDLDVQDVGLEWPGFSGDPGPFPYLVKAGRTLDLPFELPEPDCAPTAGRAPAYAMLVTAGGTFRESLDAEGRRFLIRLWRGACDELRIARVVSFRWGDHWVTEGRGETSVLRGRLILTRGDDAATPVHVTSLKGSVLFDVRLAGADSLSPDTAHSALPVEVRRGRCDQHGRSQSTQTFVWRVFVEIGDESSVARVVPPDPTQQARLLGFLDHACARAPIS